MSMTIISGYDGSDGARAALRFSKRLADALGADAVAANVYPLVPAILGKGATAGALHELRDEARVAAAKVLTDSGVSGVEQIAYAAQSPAEGLHALADERRAALVVAGGTHRGAVGKVVMGSTAEKLLHGTPCPVAVVPADAEDRPITTIGVAFDARQESRGALLAAKDLAGRLGAELIVLAVHEPMYTAYMGYGAPFPSSDLERELEDEFKKHVRAESERAVGSDFEVRVLTGSAPRMLTEAAGTGIDLLVTGSRGYGNVRGVLLGSISRHLVDHAPCPVLVMPRGVEQDVFGSATATATA